MHRVLCGLGLSAAAGAIGGAILAFPFSLFGMIMGPLLAVPVGVAIGIVVEVKNWPLRRLIIACFGQFIGAVVVGLVSNFAYDDICVNAAFVGQLVGATIGLWFAVRVIPLPAQPGYCEHCRYNLTGLSEPRCPECGTSFDPALLKKSQQDSTSSIEEQRK